jgi:hypothetical protein
MRQPCCTPELQEPRDGYVAERPRDPCDRQTTQISGHRALTWLAASRAPWAYPIPTIPWHGADIGGGRSAMDQPACEISESFRNPRDLRPRKRLACIVCTWLSELSARPPRHPAFFGMAQMVEKADISKIWQLKWIA